ncbi:hypothetical protein ElyMa_004338200 [Elysia marginata]|uniref:Uncharacterized protein n=1 Tax=Elysia marginata TaxID=1093978 RepID=A0AAV4H5E1_9GAST|nr:hypothetical protein ElyMa_004338200 [Elysia marginata]
MSSKTGRQLTPLGQWLTIALCLVAGADGLLRALDIHTQHIETVYIRHDNSRHFTKRSTDANPDELHVSFVAQNEPIKLRLKRHAQNASLPVYTLRSGQAVEKPIRETPRLSFYHDATHGATFIYTRGHNSSRPFDLDGSMFINGFEYILTPDHLFTWVGGGGAAHALKRLNSRLSFGLDAIDTRALQNSPPFLNLERDLWTSPLSATSMFVNPQAFNQPDPWDGTLIISSIYPSSETSLLKLSLL